MAYVHGTRHRPGNVIGGRILPGPPTPPHHYRSPDIVTSPYVHGTDYQLRKLRQHYYATVSWADFAAGQVLAELDNLQLTSSTAVILHSGVNLISYSCFLKCARCLLSTLYGW